MFLLLDGVLFHSGLYSAWVEPNSSAGEVEGHLHWFEQAPSYRHEAVVIGDSRIAEGFSAPTATLAAAKRLHFTNFGVPGTTPRVWYYMIRNADPDRDRFDAIVLALGQYSDQDVPPTPQDWRSDLNFLTGQLKYTDCVEFAHSFTVPEYRRSTLAGCLFRGIALRTDLQAFFRAPMDRVKRAADWAQNGKGYFDGYGGKPEVLTGLQADFEKRTIVFPAGLKDWQTNSIRTTVLPTPIAQTGMLTRYREQWLGAIVDLYRNSKTRIVFAQLPRAPLPVPEPATPARFVREIAGRPRVSVLPADTFADLENPDVFADGLHLNRAGRPIFSTRMGQRVAALLASR